MVRRKYMKRKRKSSSLFAYYITKSWVQNYLKLRQFERFYQSLGSSQVMAYAADFDVFKVAPTNINDSGIHIFSCTKSLINHFINVAKLTSSPLIFSNIQNSRLTYVQSDSLETIAQSNLSYPSAIRFDESNYHPVNETPNQSDTVLLLQNLHDQQFKTSLNFSRSLYCILTTLTIKNIN